MGVPKVRERAAMGELELTAATGIGIEEQGNNEQQEASH